MRDRSWRVGIAALVVAGLPAWALGGGRRAADDGMTAGGTARELIRERDKAAALVERLTAEAEKARGLIEELRGQIPAGAIVAYAGPCDTPRSIPPGWLPCDGTVYDGADPRYQRLHDAIGRLWGTATDPSAAEPAPHADDASPAAGAKPFRVPDLRGRFLRGHSQGSGNDPDANSRTDLAGAVVGDRVASYQDDQVGPHDHELRQSPHSHTYPIREGDKGEESAADGEGRVSENSSTSEVTIDIGVLSNGTSETRPKNAAVNYLIKL